MHASRLPVGLSCRHRRACDRPLRLPMQLAGPACLTNSATDCRLVHCKWWSLARAGVSCCGSSSAAGSPFAFLADCPDGDRARLHPGEPMHSTMNSMDPSPLCRRTSCRANPTLWAGLAVSSMRWRKTSLHLTGSTCASWHSRCLERSCRSWPMHPSQVARWCMRWLHVCPRISSSNVPTCNCVGIHALQ